MPAADSERQRDFFRTVFTPYRDLDSTTRARMQQFANDLPYLLRRAGALGILLDASKEHALLNMSGSPNRILPLPQIAVAHEDYALFDRLLQADSIQAVIVLDNGTGAITGQALQGRTDLEGLWRAVLAPVARLGADSVVNRNKTGTDHLSFLPYGVPGFNFNQLERGYGHTHHSQSDTYDMAIAADLKQAAAVMAVSAYELANLPGLIPRGDRSAPTPVQAVKVSDSLIVKGTR